MGGTAKVYEAFVPMRFVRIGFFISPKGGDQVMVVAVILRTIPSAMNNNERGLVLYDRHLFKKDR